jgi:hypothetical protein
VTGARVDGLRLQCVSVTLAAVWLVCRLTGIVHESELATGYDWCSCGRIAAAVRKCSVGRSEVGVCRLTVNVRESELATGCDWCSCGRIAAAACKCSVGRTVVGVSTNGDYA